MSDVRLPGYQSTHRSGKASWHAACTCMKDYSIALYASIVVEVREIAGPDRPFTRDELPRLGR